MGWLAYSFISALAAAGTAIFAKVGVQGVPSNLAAGLRAIVGMMFAIGVVFATGEYRSLPELKTRSIVFLILSGLCTGISWLAYFNALQLAPASRVAPIDKLSLALTTVLAVLVLGETISWRVALGTGMMVCGALVTLERP
jgi:transporter family protein